MQTRSWKVSSSIIELKAVYASGKETGKKAKIIKLRDRYTSNMTKNESKPTILDTSKTLKMTLCVIATQLLSKAKSIGELKIIYYIIYI